MPDHIEYRGLKHYPSGNAVLQKNDTGLNISRLGKSHDGILIDTDGALTWDISLYPVPIESNTVLGATFNQKDRLKRIKTVAQWAIMQCPEGSHAYLVLNSKLEGQQIHLKAKKERRELFSNAYANPRTPSSNWLIAAAFNLRAMPLTISNIDYETRFDYNKHGLVTGITITKSFCGKGIVSPGTDSSQLSAARPVVKGACYEVDQLHITSTFSYPQGLAPELKGTITQVILTGQGLDDFSIIDERHSKADNFMS